MVSVCNCCIVTNIKATCVVFYKINLVNYYNCISSHWVHTLWQIECRNLTKTPHENRDAGNHRHMKCMFNSLFMQTTNKINSELLALCEKTPLVIGGFPNNVLMIAKAFLSHDVIRNGLLQGLSEWLQWPLLLTWFDFNPSMGKPLHAW